MGAAYSDERPNAHSSSHSTDTPVTANASIPSDESDVATKQQDDDTSKPTHHRNPREALPTADTSVASEGNQNTVIGELKGDIKNNIHNGFSIEDFKYILAFVDEHFWQRKIIKETVNYRTISPQSPPANEKEYAKQFESLSEEEKLFVVTLRLFPKKRWVDFWMIYDLAARELLPKKIKKTDKQSPSVEEEDEVPPSSASERARAQSDDYWVKIAHAEIKQVTYEFTEGRTSETTIDFRSDEVSQIVATYLGNCQRQRLVRMLPVLRQLGYHAYTGIQQAAGEAVAVIAQIDFPYVRREVIDDWSYADDAHVRAAVGYILDAIMRQQFVDAEAVVLLNQWSNPDVQRTWQLRWAAAASYRLIGLHRFDIASKGLTSLTRLVDQLFEGYQDKDPPSINNITLLGKTPYAIRHALVVLALNGKTSEVIYLLAEWIAGRTSASAFRLSDLIIFATIVELSFAAIEFRKQQEHDEQGDFFDLLSNSRDIRKALADVLLYLYKQNADYRKSLMDMLAKWVECMDELKIDADPVRRIVIYLFKNSDANDRKRLLHALHRWTIQKNTAVRTLGAALESKLIHTNYPLPVVNKPPADSSEASSSGASRIVFGKS